jgi:hypothetical protein
MRIIKLQKTSESCPTQWEFITEDNRKVYLRYRFGQLNIYLLDKGSDLAYCETQKVLWMNIDHDSLEGVMSDERVYCALKLMGFTW